MDLLVKDVQMGGVLVQASLNSSYRKRRASSLSGAPVFLTHTGRLTLISPEWDPVDGLMCLFVKQGQSVNGHVTELT